MARVSLSSVKMSANCLVLMPVNVERVQGEDGSETFLSNKVLGLSLRWREFPFEWEEGQRWSVLRVFESFQDDHACAFPHQEAIPVLIERA